MGLIILSVLFIILLLSIYLGGSVAKEKAAKVSIIILIHNNWSTLKGASPVDKVLINSRNITVKLTVT